MRLEGVRGLMTGVFARFGHPHSRRRMRMACSNPANQPAVAFLGTFGDGHVLASTVSINLYQRLTVRFRTSRVDRFLSVLDCTMVDFDKHITNSETGFIRGG